MSTGWWWLWPPSLWRFLFGPIVVPSGTERSKIAWFDAMEREQLRPRPQPQNAGNPYEPTLAELEQALRINTLDLIRADAEQPELFYRVAKLLAALRADQDYAKQQLAEAEAHAQIRVRQEEAAMQEGDPKAKKMTVGEAEAMVKVDPSVVLINTKLLNIGRSIGTVQALRDAYVQRKSSLSDLVELQRQVGAAVDPAVVKRAVNEQRQNFNYQFGRDKHDE